MIGYILRRIAIAVPVLWVVATLTFFLVRAAPGGPFDAEKVLEPEVLERLESRYNLNAPLWQQYLDYLGSLLRADFGPSFRYPGRTVTEMIAAGFPVTLELALYALAFAVLVGMAAGVLAAVRVNTWADYLPMSVAMFGICAPSFVLGPLLLLVFGLWLGWLPVSGWGQLPGDKLLPSITLGSLYAAYIARLSRSGVLDVLGQDFIRTARAKGLPEWRVLLIHALRGGVLPVVGFLGPAIASLIGGSFVVETIFQVPGLGRYYVQGAFNRDYTLIMGTTIFFSALIILFNLLADLLAAALDPRVRLGMADK